MSDKYVQTYDTTLRDGTQAEGVDLSVPEKLAIAERLDRLGVNYIEGGYPLSNPKEAEFFAQARGKKFKHAKLVAFGMTRRKNTTAGRDKGMAALVSARTPTVTVVGKSWDLQVRNVLRTSLDENLKMISDSVKYLRKRTEVIYDAEHFFDAYRANPEYAMRSLEAAAEAGATTLVLCDTNGGSLPQQISQITAEVCRRFDLTIGIHAHNDAALAVANSLAAVSAGARHVQGTINGFGERCGNADLTSVLPNLILKMGYSALRCRKALANLTELSRFVYETLNMNPRENQPYVGPAAFAHKGGMHVHAVQQQCLSYEHIAPEQVGNARKLLISELSGSSAITAKTNHLPATSDKRLVRRILRKVQQLEHQGYQFELAEASFDILVRKLTGRHHRFFELDHYRTVILKQNQRPPITEATVKARIGETWEHHVAEGNGPVNALDAALRQALSRYYPAIDEIQLVDYKVRVINVAAGTAARVRVMIRWRDNGRYWGTVGVSENIIDASWQALVDGIEYHLLRREDEQPNKQT